MKTATPTYRLALKALSALLVLGFGAPYVALFFRATFTDAVAWSHIVDTLLVELVTNTLMLSGGVAIGTAVVGASAAWVTARFDFPGRTAAQWLLILPLAMPAYVMAYAYTDWLQYAGPVQTELRSAFGWESRSEYWFPEVRSLGGAIAALTLVLYPYVYLLARVAFANQAPQLSELARSFGYGPLAVFFRVALPMARPALVAGVALAVMETLADYGTVAYFGVPTFTTGVFNAWFSQGDVASAARLSMGLLAVVLVVLYLEKRARSRQSYAQTAKAPPSRVILKPLGIGVAWTVCAVPVLLGFVLPVFLLVRLLVANSVEVVEAASLQRLISAAGSSLLLAGLAAALALGVGLIAQYASRPKPSALTLTAERLISVGYAVPGTVIAVAVMIPLLAVDHQLSNFLSTVTGESVGLLLSGTATAVLYGYLLRFSTISLQTVGAGLGKIGPQLDDASRSMGVSGIALIWRVHLPMLAPSLFTAALLVFVDTMKELPATLVMRPFNFDTLAVQAYIFAKDERLAEAAVASLAIVLVGLVPIIMAARRITRED